MDTAGLVEGPWAVGETRHFGVAVNASVPVVAVVEPDRDNDGYGDETQDLCPQSQLYQAGCPLVHLSSRARAKPGAILLDVTPSAEAKIYAWGQVGWRVGVASTVKLPLPKAVIRRLNLMSQRESSRVKLFVHSMDLAGRPSTEKIMDVVRGPKGQLSRFLRTADRFSATALKFRTGPVEERRCGRIG